MHDEIAYLGAADLAARIRARELSPVEVVSRVARARREAEPEMNALVTPMPGVEERARDAEAALSRGDDVPPLHGVPFTIKDSFDTAGVRTTRGSRPLRRPRARRDAVVDHAAGRGGRHPARQDEPAGLRALVGDRQPRLRAHASTRGISSAVPAARAGARPRRRPPASRRSASEATSAARSGFRPTTAVSSA